MARRFIPPLTEADQQALAHVHQYGQKRALRRRAHAILLSDQGYTIAQIGDILEVGRNTAVSSSKCNAIEGCSNR